jgi:biopolymer transport protein ExbD
MARRKKYRPDGQQDPKLDISSCIDIAFLLLIYFITSSSLRPKEADLGMTLPTMDSATSKAKQIDQMNITLNGQGAVIVNDEVLDSDVNSRALPLLLDKLQTYKSAADLSDSKPVVIVAADDSAKGQRFIDVLNALATVGIQNVTLSGFSQK